MERNDDVGGKYLASNNSLLYIENVDLFMNARDSAISMTYYGFCLENGNYTVFLHFAEIVFIDGQTFSSLGRRIFDIYIQRELVKEGFNIAEEAGGIGKEITKTFTAVAVVSSNILEIRLDWKRDSCTTIYISIWSSYISYIWEQE